jgi:hypothetical protein
MNEIWALFSWQTWNNSIFNQHRVCRVSLSLQSIFEKISNGYGTSLLTIRSISCFHLTRATDSPEFGRLFGICHYCMEFHWMESFTSFSEIFWQFSFESVALVRWKHEIDRIVRSDVPYQTDDVQNLVVKTEWKYCPWEKKKMRVNFLFYYLQVH